MWRAIAIWVVCTVLAACWFVAQHRHAHAHMHDRADLNEWFGGLHSQGGAPCCSDSDGTALADPDWDTAADAEGHNHYRVRLGKQWVDVPDKAVVIVPNRYGQAVVWPLYSTNFGGMRSIHIQCFMPGSMT